MASQTAPPPTLLAPPVARGLRWQSAFAQLRAARRTLTSRQARRYAQLLAAVIAISALSLAVVMAPINWSLLGNYGYVGVFLITLLASGALVVPVPYLGVIVVAGMFLNPVAVALVAGVASALGEMTGYLLGKSGRAILPRNRWYFAMEKGMRRFGGPTIFVAAAVPNPFFDVAGILAGATKLPIWVFLVATFLGKSIRFFLLAMFPFLWEWIRVFLLAAPGG
jgi:membrane protein YqaA with SNARE-associated domain